MTDRLYFSYGSNLAVDQMAWRCPTAEPIRAIYIADWRLVFRGVADIMPQRGYVLCGGLWRVQPEDERALDIYEGISSGLYYKMDFRLPNGTEAFCYRMTRDRFEPPRTDYEATIREGYENFGLPTKFVDEALDHAWEVFSGGQLKKFRAPKANRKIDKGRIKR